MRARLFFIVVIAALAAVFAALNWAEFIRPTPLNLGWRVVETPLGLIMLVALAVVLLASLFSGAMYESRFMIESNRHAKALQGQRDLAEKAEASRFNDLRQQLDTHLRETRQRDPISASELEKSMAEGRRELRSQLEQLDRTLTARLAEFEERMAARWGDRTVARAEMTRSEAAARSEAAPTHDTRT